MLDIRWIRENPEALDRALKNRGAEPAAEKLIALDEVRRAAIARLQEAQTRRNVASKEIGQAKARKDHPRAEALMAEVAALKDALRAGEEAERAAVKALEDALALIPNVPAGDVPVGDESANAELRRWGEPRRMNVASEHFELGEAMGLMDFGTAAKISGSRFVVLKGGLARMERALGQFMLDLHTQEHGYTEVQPPVLVKDDALFGTAQLPKFAEDQFQTERAPESFESFSDFYSRIQEKTLAGLPEVQRQHQRLLGREMTPEEVVTSFKTASEQMRSQIEVRYKQYLEATSRLWLIPTAEVSLTNLVREQILEEEKLPSASQR